MPVKKLLEATFQPHVRDRHVPSGQLRVLRPTDKLGHLFSFRVVSVGVIMVASHRYSFDVTRQGTCKPRRGYHRPISQSQRCPPRTPSIQNPQCQCVTPEFHVVSQGYWGGARLPGSSVCTGPDIPSRWEPTPLPGQGVAPLLRLVDIATLRQQTAEFFTDSSPRRCC